MMRLFASDGKCFDVAVDHGLFNHRSFLQGIENMPETIGVISRAMPDAIQLSIGSAKFLQSIPGHKPALVLRMDVANVYGNDSPKKRFSQVIEGAVLQAVQLDAVCVVVNLLLLPGEPELHESCIVNICKLKSECIQYGMPLMVEPLVMQPNHKLGGYSVDGDISKIIPLVRQAVELGADIIKADPTENIEDYNKVIETAGDVPVLVRGGGQVFDEVILQRTFDIMKSGAKGIVYGRNIIQHRNPSSMVRALMMIVHEGITPDQALKLLQ